MLLAMLFAGCSVASTGGTDSTEGTDPSEPLDASFVERLTEGYHCGLGWYVSHDEDRSIRLGAALLPDLGHPPDTEDLEEVDATLAVGEDAATLRVYVGRCLWTPGCTDDPDHKPCDGDQELIHIYDAVAGEAHLEKNGDSTISGMITDLVLEGQDDEPTVEVAAMDLPAFGVGEQ